MSLMHRIVHRKRHGDVHGAHDTHDGHGEEGRFAGENAERYAQRSRSLARFYRSTARSLTSLAPDGGHVVDVGTGPGDLLLELAVVRPDLTITGVDLEPAMVKIADRAARTAGLALRVRALEGDVVRLPLETGTVDVVVATLTMHHWPDVPAALAEIARVLRPGGMLLVVDFGGDVERGLRADIAAVIPGAEVRRGRRWAWGIPAFVATEVRLPVG